MPLFRSSLFSLTITTASSSDSSSIFIYAHLQSIRHTAGQGDLSTCANHLPSKDLQGAHDRWAIPTMPAVLKLP